ncbi:MAG: hypothetical protein KQH79_03450 [Bacteroidetes bacterium]|nr:hypothetical protein [Bacteroidota bacterium]
MKERKLYIKQSTITALFLLIMGGIMVNSSFFLHAHKNESGKVVFHAHPFDKGAEKEDPLAKHSHSRIDLDYLSSLGHYTLFETEINLEYNPNIELELLTKPNVATNSNVYSLFSTRGPPEFQL